MNSNEFAKWIAGYTFHDIEELLDKEVRSTFPYLSLITKLAIAVYINDKNISYTEKGVKSIKSSTALRWFFNKKMKKINKRYTIFPVANKIIETEVRGYPGCAMSTYIYQESHLTKNGTYFNFNVLKLLIDVLTAIGNDNCDEEGLKIIDALKLKAKTYLRLWINYRTMTDNEDSI